MICRNCGIEIADKAIVCYRCGTGTQEPLRKPAEIRRRRSPMLIVVVLILAVLLALYGAWHYGVIGLELTIIDEPQLSGVLIDFLSGHA